MHVNEELNTYEWILSALQLWHADVGELPWGHGQGPAVATILATALQGGPAELPQAHGRAARPGLSVCLSFSLSHQGPTMVVMADVLAIVLLYMNIMDKHKSP